METQIHAECLKKELLWLGQVINNVLAFYLEGKDTTSKVPMPPVLGNEGAYGSFIEEHRLTAEERLVLILALAPEVKPEMLDVFFVRNERYDRPFTEFSGVIDDNHNGFVPTVGTAIFILTAGRFNESIAYRSLFADSHFFIKDGVFTQEISNHKQNLIDRRLGVTQEFLSYFITGEMGIQEFRPDFPARLITSELTWKEVILNSTTKAQINEIQDWLEYNGAMFQDPELARRFKPGYRALFYGPPGTGKTLTATMIGKTAGRDVYRIDLSSIVSKYIGETQKNLAKIFDRAENKKWILFFDEADALFSRRTEVNTSNDRNANQDVAFLLQRIESFNGMVVLATNYKENIDKAFLRRFQSVVYFPKPGEKEREALWRSAFPASILPEVDVSMAELANRYDVSGAVINNAVFTCVLQAIKHGRNQLGLADINNAVHKELLKEGVLL